MITTDFNSETGILVSTYEGHVSLHDVVEYIESTKNNSSYPRKLKILSHAVESQFDFAPDDLETIVAANNQSLQNYDLIIDAIVIDSPREAALTILYEEMARNRKYKFKVFNTTKAAMIWLEKE